LDAPTPTVAAAGAKPAKPKQESQDPAFKQEFQQVKDLRAFFAECLSPSNPADLQTLSSADRLKKACVSNADKFASIFTLPSEGNPEVPPEVVEAMYALIDDATFSKLQEAKAQGAWAGSEGILQQHFSSLPAERFESLNTAIDQSMSAFKAPVTLTLASMRLQISNGTLTRLMWDTGLPKNKVRANQGAAFVTPYVLI
jgi:hypothetical protein